MRARYRKHRLFLAVAAALSAIARQEVSSAATPAFTAGITSGTIQNASIGEASGIVASRVNPNVLWTHNDSGNMPQVFAMTPAGTNLGTYNVSGATNRDWEDIAIGAGPVANTSYLYIGEIGDNNAVHPSVSVYRVPEPAVSDTQTAGTFTLNGAEQFTFTYPDGPRDAESLFIDPLTRDLYIISKRDTTKHVYRAAYPQTVGPTILEKVTELPNANWITAADMSPDGNEIIMRAGAPDTGLMYIRPPGGSVADAFATTPISIPLLMEKQGEAIGFDASGHGYFTTSEGAHQPINYFDRLPPAAIAMYYDADGKVDANRAGTGAGMGGAGAWDAASLKWYNGACDVVWANGNDAVFWGANGGSVTLASAQTVNSLSFKATGYVVTSSTVTLAGASITVDAGMTATISSVLAGTSGLVKNGSGTLQLKTANTYSGGTTINGGVLAVVSSSVGANPASPVTNITVNNGATLRYDVTNLTLAVNRNVLLGPGGGVFDVQGFSDAIAGVISGSSFTKAGAGTLTLTNVNTYTGATNVLAGTLVLTQDLTATASVNVSSGATMRFAAGSASMLRTSAVSVVGTGRLDLTDNKLIVNAGSAGSWTGSNYDGITGLIQSGRNGGSWTGAGGIVTSMSAAANSNYTTLGFAKASDIGITATALWSGQTVGSDDLLVMYTYGGDANLDGKVNIDDYVRIDTGIASGLSGWSNGDFNYDGTINIDDYTTVIDVNIGNQGGAFPTGGGIDVVSVPEPTGVSGILMASATIAMSVMPRSSKRLIR